MDERPPDEHVTGHMQFHRMDDMTPSDFEVLREVHQENLQKLPDLLLSMLDLLGGDEAYPVDRRVHSLQAATRALRDGRDEEYVVVTLLHDISETLGPLNHGDVIAAILKPFISESNHWMLEHHPLFQTYFYGTQVGVAPNGRDRFREGSYFDQTAEFCPRYDEGSSDPDYASEPIEVFVPMVHRVLNRTWAPPNAEQP